MNKNISVWRGVVSPPTYSHVWIKNDNEVLIYKYNKWAPLIEDATEEQSGLMSKTDKQILDLLNKNLHWN